MCFIKEGTRKCKIAECISYVTLFLAMLMMLTVFYWLIFPYKTIEIKKDMLPIIDKQVKTGEVLRYELDYCKFNELDVLISRKFVDGLLYSVPDITTKNESGCRTSIIGITIPETLPEGSYYLEIKYSYRVNPIRVVSVQTHTDQFEVVK